MSLFPRVTKQETLVLMDRELVSLITRMMGLSIQYHALDESDISRLLLFLEDAHAGLDYDIVDDKKSIEQYKALLRKQT